MMLARIPGMSEAMAASIVSRALSWPDAFPPVDSELAQRAQSWRPWRGYAAMHLTLPSRTSWRSPSDELRGAEVAPSVASPEFSTASGR
jgi:3-methyladenine DNA glycosylase/8-oxoguanine DNA glycosylase